MTQQLIDERYMARCIQIAQNGLGSTYPNPFVGSIIVHNQKILAEGYTSAYGGPHAEVNAIRQIKDDSILKECTLYVTLEPCSHYGKTPPCCDLVIAKEFKRVVIGTLDPFAEVNGQGYLRLLENGIDVTLGILEEECKELNRRFITFHQEKRPYIILKWAQTQDGYMGHDDVQKWITNRYSRQLVHEWRTEEQAILVGKKTALVDNPQLNTRFWEGKNPLRISIDKFLAIPRNFHLYDQSIPTVIFNAIEDREDKNLKLVKIDFDSNIIPPILDYLYQNNFQTLIVEGGSDTIQKFIDMNLWDEARVLSSNAFWNQGILAPIVRGKRVSQQKIINDHVTVIRNQKND
ncbi:bifunctional diaminohydroxyphosphoribosylaminopyrimidine deaminase/5-amino-6-(5-phosphoribosylamino)uracil reductase RibD [Faecalibacter sp. LW9]|uniref:bifunctional diaminohydroxyphosphoribosylaminopyrimidine deaminase/5-amino-6-(5-phosphoribosylamino)uracil reductase RibD n=1 Tax=Faecalibacter sp. LW9 TaxID=3103144 RepID=UPI002AFDFDBB|nr:bifunctional diaminohydroxyphosphoribosylaminopyrimidine deaminase/5-amino-6-(5-phosphoribosylamino)uracil reductase RibD [Faecalibacter sp. LW9]